MDGPGHLLSLKVMRLSRPALASAWEPFYSNTPSFSAHSTASVLSLQGGTPLPGHPKTLRDLTNASTLLTLPSSFGAIQLGETFSGALAVNNESAATVDGVTLRVEMQTATSKVPLVEMGGPTLSLVAGDTLEATVHHEIKELGQHVLACTVSYQLPPGARRPALPVTSITGAGSAEAADDIGLQTFRKFYKFAVTNPLSVKTKVHVPRSPSALLSIKERTKVFLEVHIQNLTPESMWFERMTFEPAPGWNVQDANLLPDSKESVFSGPMALMQPQDTRQYVYILNEITLPAIPVQHAPGTVLPLGRLDISWRSSFGEPGRLLTSMLSRRIPIPTNQPPVRPLPQQQQAHQPVSALPPHLQRSATVTGYASQPPSRPGTPQIGAAAPYRAASPFRNRPTSVPPRPQSPVTSPLAIASAHLSLAADPIDVDLVVRSIPRGGLPVDRPFRVACTLGVTALVHAGQQRRTLSLAVQHVQLSTTPSPPPPPATTTTIAPVSRSNLATTTTAPSSPALFDGSLVGSPRTTRLAEQQEEDDPSSVARQQHILLPPPEPITPGDEKRHENLKLRGATRFLGASTLLVPLITLVVPTPADSSVNSSGDRDDKRDDGRVGGAAAAAATGGVTKRGEGFWDFELEYAPLRTGFVSVGGLRVLLLEDQVDGAAEAASHERRGTSDPPVVLREWDVIGEIWVKS